MFTKDVLYQSVQGSTPIVHFVSNMKNQFGDFDLGDFEFHTINNILC
jgi:hypothetical protein